MNKILNKILLVFVFPLFIAFPAYAVTFQGGDTVAMQGAQSTIFPSANSDEFAHDFADLVGWTTSGSASIVSGQLEVVTALTGADWARSPSLTTRQEYWIQFKYKLNSISDLVANERTFGTGLRSATIGNIATVGIQGIGTDQHWYVRWKTDASEGSNLGDLSSPQIVTGADYTVVIHWKSATAPAADDGVFQAWAISNGAVQTLADLSNIDSDTVTAELFQGGNFDSSGIIATILIDDLVVGTTGQEYVP